MESLTSIPTTCPECRHSYSVPIEVEIRAADTRRFSAQQFVGTYAGDLTEKGVPWKPKPVATPRVSAPSWLAPGVLVGTGLATVPIAMGARAPIGVWVTCVSFSAFAAWYAEHRRTHQPRERRERTTVRVKMDGGDRGERDKLQLACDLRQLRTFAAEVSAVGSTSETAWTGSGRPFSRTEYYTLRDELIKGGYGHWKNERHHAQGWDLTAKGQALMRGLSPAPRP